MTGLKAVRTLDEAALDEGRMFFANMSEASVAAAGKVSLVISAPADSDVKLRAGNIEAGWEQMAIKAETVASVTGGTAVPIVANNATTSGITPPVMVKAPTSTGAATELFSWTEEAIEVSTGKKRTKIDTKDVMYVMKRGTHLSLTFENSGATGGPFQIAIGMTVQG